MPERGKAVEQTKTTPPPSVAKKAAEPLMARRKDRGQNHEQDGVERSLTRERAFVSSRTAVSVTEDNDSTQRDLKIKRQILGLPQQARFQRVSRMHS